MFNRIRPFHPPLYISAWIKEGGGGGRVGQDPHHHPPQKSNFLKLHSKITENMPWTPLPLANLIISRIPLEKISRFLHAFMQVNFSLHQKQITNIFLQKLVYIKTVLEKQGFGLDI